MGTFWFIRYMKLLLEEKLGLAYKPNSEFSTLVSFLVISYERRIGKSLTVLLGTGAGFDILKVTSLPPRGAYGKLSQVSLLSPSPR